MLPLVSAEVCHKLTADICEPSLTLYSVVQVTRDLSVDGHGMID